MNSNRFRCRKAVSTVQYAMVSLVCISIATAAAFILSKSFEQVGNLSQSVAWNAEVNSQQQTDRDCETASTIVPSATDNRPPSMATQLFVVASTLLIIGFAYLYLRQGKKIRRAEQAMTCHVNFLENKNLALEAVLDKRQKIHNQLRLENLSFGSGFVKDIMSTNVETMAPDLSIEKAEKSLRDAGFRRTIIVDEVGNLNGVLSLKDISTKHGNCISEIMTSAPKTATEDMEIRLALTILLQNRISCLPVVKGNKFIGLVTTSDMLIYLQCMLSAMEANPENEALVTG